MMKKNKANSLTLAGLTRQADELKIALNDRTPENAPMLRAAANKLTSDLWSLSGHQISKKEHFHTLQKKLADAISFGRIQEAKDRLDELFAI